MKRTIDFTRLDTSEPAVYPSGTPKDQSSVGAGDGTLINEVYTRDVFNLFWKWVRDTGVIPNGNFDNEDNGYQLHEAFTRAVNGSKRRILINQNSGDDTEYTIERDIDIVLVGAFGAGYPNIILPADPNMTNKTVRIAYNSGNYGALPMDAFTGLTLSTNESSIVDITWCDVHYDGSEWRLAGWGLNAL